MGERLTMTEAAAELGITERTIYQWVTDKKIKTTEPTAVFPRLVPISEIKRLKSEPRKRRNKNTPLAASTKAADRKTAAAGGD